MIILDSAITYNYRRNRRPVCRAGPPLPDESCRWKLVRSYFEGTKSSPGVRMCEKWCASPRELRKAMPKFHYIARDDAGQRVSGTIAAASRREAVAVLAGRSIFPLQVEDAAPAVEKRRIRRVPAAAAGRHLRPIGRSAAQRRAAVAVAGGDRETDLARRAESRSWSEVHRQVEDGATLADAMAPLPARVRRNGREHGPRRRRGRIPRRGPGPRGRVHRDPGRSARSAPSARWPIRPSWPWSARSSWSSCWWSSSCRSSASCSPAPRAGRTARC